MQIGEYHSTTDELDFNGVDIYWRGMYREKYYYTQSQKHARRVKNKIRENSFLRRRLALAKPKTFF